PLSGALFCALRPPPGRGRGPARHVLANDLAAVRPCLDEGAGRIVLAERVDGRGELLRPHRSSAGARAPDAFIAIHARSWSVGARAELSAPDARRLPNEGQG